MARIGSDEAFAEGWLRTTATGLFEELHKLSFDGVGVTRECFGPLETEAQNAIARVATAHGLEIERDRACNLVVTLAGRDRSAPHVATGSHLDSVPRGGNYDGAAGVVAGLLALVGLRKAGVVPPRDLKLYALRGEESAWFGKSWIGSHALFGLLSERDLARPRFDTGRSLQSCLEDVGADIDAIARGMPLVRPADIAAFFEVHIEQGPVLEAQGLPLGVVTAIYGNLRHMNVTCRGQAAHAGATPRDLRHDAVVAASDLIMRMDRHWARRLEEGRRLVITHGILGTNPSEHAVSRVPGEARMSVEIRAEDSRTLDEFHDLLLQEADAVAASRGVRFAFDEAIINRPAPMHPGLADSLARICQDYGIPHVRLPSGAGHDAAVFAHAGVPTAMLFIRNQHGSHNPEEGMEIADFVLATRVLARALLAAS